MFSPLCWRTEQRNVAILPQSATRCQEIHLNPSRLIFVHVRQCLLLHVSDRWCAYDSRILALSRELRSQLIGRQSCNTTPKRSKTFLSFVSEASVFQSFTPRTRETSVTIRMKSNNTCWTRVCQCILLETYISIVIVIANQINLPSIKTNDRNARRENQRTKHPDQVKRRKYMKVYYACISRW